MTHVEEVTKKFIHEIQKKGMAHTLQWISGWYKDLAQAAIEDSVDAELAAHPQRTFSRQEKSVVTAIACLEIINSQASSIDNHSTSQGANMLTQARLAAAASTLSRIHEFNLRTHRDTLVGIAFPEEETQATRPAGG